MQERQIVHAKEFDDAAKKIFGSAQVSDEALRAVAWKIARETDFNISSYARFGSVFAASAEYRRTRVIVFFTISQNGESATLLSVMSDPVHGDEE